MNYRRLIDRMKKFPKQVLMAVLIVIQKSENFLNKRNVKTTKQVLKDFACSYNVENLNTFQPEQHLQIRVN